MVEAGGDALDFLRCEGDFDSSQRSGLVEVDVNMPRENGFEVLTKYVSSRLRFQRPRRHAHNEQAGL